ncbi:MAG: hypothetical protein QNJ91_01925, partial [Gammaproteobacteria bacterium]|nr:hypothetical protein [Gammaproteobacteria bacterium]
NRWFNGRKFCETAIVVAGILRVAGFSDILKDETLPGASFIPVHAPFLGETTRCFDIFAIGRGSKPVSRPFKSMTRRTTNARMGTCGRI